MTVFSCVQKSLPFRWGLVLLYMVLLGLSSSTYSWEDWEFSGFASFGIGRLNLSDHSYIDYKNGDWGTHSDSILALQANKQFTDRLGFGAQVVSNGYNFSDDTAPYEPELAWVFLSYELNPNTRLRLGRIRNPFYFYSTTQEVGYTYNWVRPPVSVYNLFFNPFKDLDGADLTFNSHVNNANIEYQIFAGQTEGEYEGIEVTVTEAIGGRVTASWIDTAIYLTVEQFKGDASPPDSFEALQAGFELYEDFFAADPTVSQAFGDVADAFEASDQYTQSFSGGIEWNLDNWNFLSEFFLLRGENKNYSNDSDGYYASAAYRFEYITPYLVYGQYENRFSGDTARKITHTETLVPTNTNPQLDALRSGTRFALNEYNATQATTILGLRYDFHPKADFKAEVEYFQLQDNGGIFYADDPTDTRPKEAVLISFVIDVVF